MELTSDLSKTAAFSESIKAAQLVSGLFLCTPVLSSEFAPWLAQCNQLTQENLAPCPYPRIHESARLSDHLHDERYPEDIGSLDDSLIRMRVGTSELPSHSIVGMKIESCCYKFVTDEM